MFSFNLSVSIGTSSRSGVIARCARVCAHKAIRVAAACEAVSRNSWAHYPLSRALCIKHRAHNRGYDLARDRDPLLVRRTIRALRGSPHSTALRSTSTTCSQSRGLSAVTHLFSPSNALALPSVASCFLLFLSSPTY